MMQGNTRVLCVWIPRFGLALCCREDPHLLLEPTALAEGEGESALLCEVSRKAAKAGAAIGMTAAQAGTLCAGLIVKVKSSYQEDKASREIVATLQRIAPFVEVAAPGRYFIEASGFGKLYGGEQALAERVITAIQNFDLSAQVGCAENAFVAQVACEQARRETCQRVDTGRAREFLEPLPVKYLSVAEEIKEQLVALGLRTIGQVAAFPINELTERFGAEGRLLAHLARGEDPKHFDPLQPEEDVTERLTLDYPLFSTMAVSARVEKLLATALDKLAIREMGASRMLLRLQFDNRSHKELELAVDRPTLSVRKFLRQLQGEWERLTFPAAVVELALTPMTIAPMATKQMELASRQAHSAATISPAENREMVFRIELRRSLLPEESFELVASTPGHNPVLADARPGSRPDATEDLNGRSMLRPYGDVGQALVGLDEICNDTVHEKARYVQDEVDNWLPSTSLVGLRLVNPVQAIEVICERESLCAVIINRRRHAVCRQHGPWLICGRWWEERFSREYYEIEASGGEAYLIFRAGNDADCRWYLQGMFD